jgi:hypothetical protein
MPEFDINKMPLRGLKIIRKGYKNHRSDPQMREKLHQINALIASKQRRYSLPKKVTLINPPTPNQVRK